MEREIRNIGIESELRATRRGRNIDGYGIVFNKESVLLGDFVEEIAPDAVNGVLETQDILCLLNHSEERGLLARYTNGEGTMTLTVDKIGVKYSFEAPETALGDEVLSGVRRGDIRTSSFAFKCTNPKNQKWEKREDGIWKRTILKFEAIYDMSPVYREAYPDTTVALRGLVEHKSKENMNTLEQRISDLEKELKQYRSPSDSTDEIPDNLRREVLKDGTIIAYQDWLSKGSMVYIEKDGVLIPAPDGTMQVREREEVYTSSMEMVIKNGIAIEIKQTSQSVQRKEPENLDNYFVELRKKIVQK